MVRSLASTTFFAVPFSIASIASCTEASKPSRLWVPERITKGSLTRYGDLFGHVAPFTVVSQLRPSRDPMIAFGTIKTLSLEEESAKAMLPKATRPVPGRFTESSTEAVATSSLHCAASEAIRFAPVAVRRTASPKPMIPPPLRMKAVGVSGNCSTSSPLSASGSSTVTSFSKWILT